MKRVIEERRVGGPVWRNDSRDKEHQKANKQRAIYRKRKLDLSSNSKLGGGGGRGQREGLFLIGPESPTGVHN